MLCSTGRHAPRATVGLAIVTAIMAVCVGVAVVSAPATAADELPSVLPLPDGFSPEGVEIGRDAIFYVGSVSSGAIYRGNLRTGEGSVLVPPVEGRLAFGLSYDRSHDRLFVAGGMTGSGYVYDAETGELLGDFPLGGSFVNDVVVTPTAAYFTDSFRPVLYRLPLGAGGSLPGPDAVETVVLDGVDFVSGDEGPAVNSNGIDATADGEHLFVVNSTTEKIYRVDAKTGRGRAVHLGGETVASGDGLLLDGLDLYVVQNFLNQIAVVRLDPSLESGEVTRIISSPHFDIPTTVSDFGDALYAVNARFTATPGPDVSYDVVRVPKR